MSGFVVEQAAPAEESSMSHMCRGTRLARLVFGSFRRNFSLQRHDMKASFELLRLDARPTTRDLDLLMLHVSHPKT